jgi:drug/metabolite transporter (DMT)-like permease
LGAFAAAVTVGGANFIAVRYSNQELAPFWGASLRFGAAGVLFAIVAVSLRLPWPRGRRLADTLLYGVLSFALSYALLYWALLRIEAGTATIVMAVVPLMTLLLAAAQRLETLHWRGVVGALLALVGILWIAIGPEGVQLPLGPLLALLASAVCVGQSIILGKRVAANHPATTNAVGMVTGTAVLLALSAATGEPWVLPAEASAVWAVIYLATLGSLGLFVLVLLVMRRWTASASSYLFVLFPVVTIALGALIAGEAASPRAAVGAAVVMVGVWFGALSPGARRVATPPPEAVAATAGELD